MTTLSINGKLLGKVNGIEIERCEGCGGLWFDRGEAAMLKGVSGLVAERLDTGDPRLGATMNLATEVACPRCATTMAHVDYPGQDHITFEQCSGCQGQFFDAGEFKDAMVMTFGERVRAALSSFPGLRKG